MILFGNIVGVEVCACVVDEPLYIQPTDTTGLLEELKHVAMASTRRTDPGPLSDQVVFTEVVSQDTAFFVHSNVNDKPMEIFA